MKAHNYHFSIIELMVVIFVVLLLGSMSLPLVSNLYQTANEVVCKNNMKNIGGLCIIYANDHDGYLPGYYDSDTVMANGVTKSNQYYVFSLYKNWHGHLMPYLQPELKEYFRTAGVYKDNNVYTYNGNIPSGNSMGGGYQVVKDAYELGGYGNLKTLICPQAFKTEDRYTSGKYEGTYLPRVSGLTNSGKINNKGFSCVAATPTSYIANSDFFTDSYKNSVANGGNSRLSEIHQLEKKTLIVEGNQPLEGSYQGNHVYFEPDDYIGHDSVKNNILGDDKRIFSFLHEGFEEFWASDKFGGKYSGNLPNHVIDAFNKAFYPEAVLIKSYSQHWERRVVVRNSTAKAFFARQDVKDFFQEFNYSIPGSISESIGVYVDLPYVVGEMHVLKGDGSVVKQNSATVHDKELNAYTKN